MSIAPTSFETLWHRYWKPLYYFVTGALHDSGVRAREADAEDAVQEIMLKVYRGLDTFDGHRSLTAWVYTIARNHCVDIQRQRRARPVPPMRTEDEFDVDALPATRQDEPEHALLAGELRRTVDDFMRALTDEDRTMLFLRFYEELPYAEIARLTERPEGTVKYRVHELKNRLKAYLEARQ